MAMTKDQIQVIVPVPEEYHVQLDKVAQLVAETWHDARKSIHPPLREGDRRRAFALELYIVGAGDWRIVGTVHDCFLDWMEVLGTAQQAITTASLVWEEERERDQSGSYDIRRMKKWALKSLQDAMPRVKRELERHDGADQRYLS